MRINFVVMVTQMVQQCTLSRLYESILRM